MMKRRDPNRQVRYEQWLDRQSEKEKNFFFRDLPFILNDQIPKEIKDLGELPLTKDRGLIKDHPNWEGRTLPRLRGQWKALKAYTVKPWKELTFNDYNDASKLLQDLVFHMNGWSTSAGYSFELKTEMEGQFDWKANIVVKTWLSRRFRDAK